MSRRRREPPSSSSSSVASSVASSEPELALTDGAREVAGSSTAAPPVVERVPPWWVPGLAWRIGGPLMLLAVPLAAVVPWPGAVIAVYLVGLVVVLVPPAIALTGPDAGCGAVLSLLAAIVVGVAL